MSIAIVEDHRLLADTLGAALSRRGVDALVMSCHGPDLLARIVAAEPRLVLLDLDLGADGDGAALIAPLTERGVRVLVVTGSADRLRIAAALEQGAIGYQRKDDGFDALLEVTCRALDGHRVLADADRSALLCELARARRDQQREFAPFERLTEREREVLEALAEGRSVREMADDWVVSDTTVRAHVRGILSKLGTSSQLGAVAAGMRSGWLRHGSRPRVGV